MQKNLRICNTAQDIRLLLRAAVLRAPHGYARLDPDT